MSIGSTALPPSKFASLHRIDRFEGQSPSPNDLYEMQLAKGMPPWNPQMRGEENDGWTAPAEREWFATSAFQGSFCTKFGEIPLAA